MPDVLRWACQLRDSDESGQGMIEYTLILGTISLVVVAAYVTTGIESAMGSLASDLAATIQP